MVNFFGRYTVESNGITDFTEQMQDAYDWEGTSPKEINELCVNLYLHNENIPLWQKAVILERKFTYLLIAKGQEGVLKIIETFNRMVEDEDPFVRSIAYLCLAYFHVIELSNNPSCQDHAIKASESLEEAKKTIGPGLQERNILSAKYYFLLGNLKVFEGKHDEAVQNLERAEWIFSEIGLPYHKTAATLSVIQVKFISEKYKECETLLHVHQEEILKYDILNFRSLQMWLEMALMNFGKAEKGPQKKYWASSCTFLSQSLYGVAIQLFKTGCLSQKDVNLAQKAADKLFFIKASSNTTHVQLQPEKK